MKYRIEILGDWTVRHDGSRISKLPEHHPDLGGMAFYDQEGKCLAVPIDPVVFDDLELLKIDERYQVVSEKVSPDENYQGIELPRVAL